MAASFRRRARQTTGRQAKGVPTVTGKSRLKPSESGQERQGWRRKLSRPPQRGETGELTTSILSEREGRENTQWRRKALAFRRLDGGLGEAALPPVRERRSKLSWPPLGASQDNAATTNEKRRCRRRPTRAGKVTRRELSKALGAASSLLEASIRELQRRNDDGTVKPARTPSGGRGPTAL